jgi:hypothetical protein
MESTDPHGAKLTALAAHCNSQDARKTYTMKVRYNLFSILVVLKYLRLISVNGMSTAIQHSAEDPRCQTHDIVLRQFPVGSQWIDAYPFEVYEFPITYLMTLLESEFDCRAETDFQLNSAVLTKDETTVRLTNSSEAITTDAFQGETANGEWSVRIEASGKGTCDWRLEFTACDPFGFVSVETLDAREAIPPRPLLREKNYMDSVMPAIHLSFSERDPEEE